MRKRSLFSNLGLLAAALLFFALLLEGGLRLALLLGAPGLVTGDERYRREVARLSEQVSGESGLKNPYMLLHPYFGYTNVPGSTSVHGESVNNMGFATPVDFPYHKKSDDEYVIAVFGGSVTEILSVSSSGTLVDVLKESAAFADRKITVINCATGAYKQPQQLLILAYLLSQGMEFDCVVNVDGFNEVAIAGVNRKKGTNIFYPAVFYWDEMINYLTSGTEGLLNNPRYMELVYRRSQYMKTRRTVLGLMLNSPLKNSALARFCLARWLGVVERKQGRVEDELKAISRGEASTWVKKMKHGPSRESELEAAAACWARSSMLMKDLCDDAGALYIHVLQPNQYDPRGKALTAREREEAYNPKSPFRNGGEWGYPLLRKEALRVEASGVKFRDLSLIFNEVEGDIYVDDCCHFNQRGNDLVMEAIGATIIDATTR